MPPPFALLSPRQRVSLRGPDRVRFLNGQMTNDCRRTPNGSQIPSCILSAKGKLQFVIHVSVTPDALICDAPVNPDGPTLLERLDRYLIADQLELTDDSENWALLHFPNATPESLPPQPNAETFPSKRLGSNGTDLWIPSATVPEWLNHPERLNPEAITLRRILAGIPEWGPELDEDTLPAEAGLDRTHIDFHKGCYIGQEVVSRIKSVGRVNRCLVRITSDHPLPPKTPLVSAGRECGQITTSANSNGKYLALAFIHRTADRENIACAEHPVLVQSLLDGSSTDFHTISTTF